MKNFVTFLFLGLMLFACDPPNPNTPAKELSLEQRVTSTDRDVQKQALEELVTLSTTNPEMIKLIIESFLDNSVEVRNKAAWAAAQVGEPALSFLTEALQHEEPMIRKYAARALGNMGEKAIPAIEALCLALKDSVVEVRVAVAQSFGEMETAAATAVPSLQESLQDESEEVRMSVADSLIRIGPEGIAVLVSAMVGDNPLAQKAALAFLNQIPFDQVPIHDLLNHKTPEIRAQSLGILDGIPREKRLELLPQIQTALVDSEPNVQVQALGVLRGIGEEIRSMVPEITPLLQHEKREVRMGSLRALEKIRPQSREAIEAMARGVLDQEDTVYRRFTAKAFGEKGYGENAKYAVPFLRQALKDHSRDVRKEAIRALMTIGPGAKDSIPDLLESLVTEKNPKRVVFVTRALSSIGQATPEVIAALENAAQNEKGEAKKAARQALDKLQGK